MSQQKIAAYMERHKIGPLFEDLMNKILRDQPEEPLIYMLRTVYKKAGVEIPQNIRHGGLRKSGGSPDRAARYGQTSESADVNASRDYEKPWASNARRVKPKKGDLTGSTEVKPKVTSSFDQLWGEGHEADPGRRSGGSPTKVRKSAGQGSANAWASVGLKDEEGFTSPEYHGARPQQQRSTKVTEAELVEAETFRRGRSGGEGHEAVAVISRSHIGGPKYENKRERMRELLSEKDTKEEDSGIDDSLEGGYGDSIELLENADDLRREGVVNIPQSGYKLSKAMRQRSNEPTVKLQINLNTSLPQGQIDSGLWRDSLESFDDLRSARSERSAHGETPSFSPDFKDSDDEFESVSQVTGPRQPVWKVSDSDGERASPPTPSPPPRRPRVARKAHTPSDYFDQADEADHLFHPTKTTTPQPNRVSFDEANLDPLSSRTEQSLVSHDDSTNTGGWRLPDESEVASGYDWNQRVKGRPPRDPKAY